MTSPQKRMTRLAAVRNLAGRPTDSHSFDGDNAGIGSDGERERESKGGRKERRGGGTLHLKGTGEITATS